LNKLSVTVAAASAYTSRCTRLPYYYSQKSKTSPCGIWKAFIILAINHHGQGVFEDAIEKLLPKKTGVGALGNGSLGF
jgi:hypothetical protein